MRVVAVVLVVGSLGPIACEQAPAAAPPAQLVARRDPAPAVRPPDPAVQPPVQAAPPLVTSPRDLDIREAALRYMFRHNASGQQLQAHVYCIGLPDIDPSAAFVARLGDVRPTVKPISACDAGAGDGVLDKATGQLGLIFHAGAIRWIDADHAELDGGYYEAGLSASGNTYYLQRQNGAWLVTKDVMHWIS